MNDRLSNDLETQARALDVPAGDLDRVVRRGRRRSRRHRQATASLAVMAVLAGTVGAVRVADAGRQSAAVSADGGTVDGTLGDAGISWARQQPTTPLGPLFPTETADGDDQLYALSTGPGVRATDGALRKVVWQSADGVDWTLGSTPDSFYLSDLTTADGRLYAIGTGPATAATAGGRGVPDVRVGWTDAGRTQWDQSTLPIDMGAIAAGSTSVHVSGQDVAVGPKGVVAVATVTAELDVPALLPDGVEAPNGWGITDDGVAVLGDGEDCPPGTFLRSEVDRGAPGLVDYSPCTDGGDDATTAPATEVRGVVASYTWAQLHVAGDLLQAVRREPFVFHADAVGEPFIRVDAPTGSVLGWTPLVQVGNDGFDLVLGRQASSGQDHLGHSEIVALHSDDGVAWQQPSAVGDTMSWVAAVGRVDGRLAVIGSSDAGGAIYAELVDGRWRTTSLTDLLDRDPAKSWISAAGIGPLGAVVAVTTDGDGDATTSTLLASRDGRTWARQSVEDLAGARISSVNSVAVRGDRAVVMVSLPRSGAEAVRPQVALVGTPR